MTRSNHSFTSDDFRTGQFDEFFQTLNTYNGGVFDKYTPINSHQLSYNELDKIWLNPTFVHILSIWNANIGANGRKFVINTNATNSDTTKGKKDQYAKRMYNFLYTKKNWSKLEKQIIAITAREGSCIMMADVNGEQAVWSLRRFHVYHDSVLNETRYAFLDNNNREIASLTNLKHGEDLWHIKDPAFEDWIVPPSRIDCAYLWILLQNNGLKSNNFIFANAFIGTTLLGFTSDAISSGGKVAVDTVDDKQVPDKNGKTVIGRMVDKINDTFRGVKKSFRVGYAFGLDKVHELGKSNADMQFMELLVRSKSEIVSAYSLTLSDLGDGDKGLTYNNASTFSYNVFGKIGQPFEELLDQVTNDWFCPSYGITTTENAYFDYNKPNNPDRLAVEEQARKNWESNTMKLNEVRELQGLEPIDGGDVFYKDFATPPQSQTDPNQDTIDVESKPKEPPKQLQNGFFTKVAYAQKTPTEKALESELYLGNNKKNGFLNRWIEAITKQLETYIKTFAKLDNEALNDYIVKLPKIETFYSFPALKKDLLGFAGMALDEVKKDKRTNFTLNFFDGEYPQVVLDNIDKFTEAVLKGNPEMFDSIDVETTSQIQNIIKTNVNSGVSEIAIILSDKIQDLAFNRAELIASTAVTESVEKTREALYLIEFPDGSKEWITSVQDVCRLCMGNERQGKIDIDKVFSSGVSAPSAHSRCRCSCLFYPKD
jgi:hypothetical protein